MLVKKREYLAVTYFISRALFLGVGFSFMYRESGKDSWIAILLGYLVGNIFIYIYHKIGENIDFNLNNLFNKATITAKFYKLFFAITYIFLILYMSVIFTNFVKVYYLFDTPIYATLLLLYAIAFYGASKSEKTIIRTSFILFPISVILIILNASLLSPLTNFINFLPVFTYSTKNIFLASLVFISASALPNILTIEYKTTLKAKLVSYAFVTFIILLINICITSVLGEYLITTYSYPEYMVLRRIKFLDFIENVENFASILWYFDAFILITLSLIKLKKLLPQNKENKIIIPGLIIASFLSYQLFSNHFSTLNYFLEYGIAVLLTSLLVTTFPLYFYTKKKKKSAYATS